MLNFSIFETYLNHFSKFHIDAEAFLYAPSLPRTFESPFESPIWIGLTFEITVTNDSLLFDPLQPTVVFHIETVKL